MPMTNRANESGSTATVAPSSPTDQATDARSDSDGSGLSTTPASNEYTASRVSGSMTSLRL